MKPKNSSSRKNQQSIQASRFSVSAYTINGCFLVDLVFIATRKWDFPFPFRLRPLSSPLSWWFKVFYCFSVYFLLLLNSPSNAAITSERIRSFSCLFRQFNDQFWRSKDERSVKTDTGRKKVLVSFLKIRCYNRHNVRSVFIKSLMVCMAVADAIGVVDVTSVKFWFVYVSSFNSLQLPGKCSVDIGCKIHCLNMFLFV